MKKIGLNFLESQEPFQVHLGFLKFWRIVDSTIINKKLVKNPLKITVIFKGDDNYNPRTKSAYVYQEIKKLKGLKKKVKYNGQLKLSLNTKKKLNVYFKLSKKIYKIKFNKNGEASFKIGKYNFKKGKTYNIKFYSKSKLYRVNVNHKLTIMKS